MKDTLTLFLGGHSTYQQHLLNGTANKLT